MYRKYCTFGRFSFNRFAISDLVAKPLNIKD